MLISGHDALQISSIGVCVSEALHTQTHNIIVSKGHNALESIVSHLVTRMLCDYVKVWIVCERRNRHHRLFYLAEDLRKALLLGSPVD